MIEVARRKPTVEEMARWRARREVAFRAVAEGVVFLLLLPLGGFGAGRILEWAAARLLGPVAPWPAVVLTGIGAALSLFLLVAWCRSPRRPEEPPVVEEIHVSDAVLVEAEEMVDEGPILFFGAGDGTILFLAGQWMLDPAVFADGRDGADRFPSSEFRLVREPGSGTVLRVEVLGRSIEPVRVHGRGSLAIPPLANGARFAGSPDRLKDALRGLG